MAAGSRGIGDVHVVVEDAHGKGDLRQLAVGHDHVGLEAAVLRRAHAGEVHAVLRAPVMLLQVAQVMGHHGDVRAPLLLQPDEHAHADGMHSGLPHAVETIEPPLELRLHAARMVDVVVHLVIGLLEADDAVHPVLHQFRILLRLQGHHLYLQVAEVRLGQVEGTRQIGHAGLGGVLARHDEQVFKRGQLLDGLVFVLDFLLRQDGAAHRVADVEAAIDARVGAGIGDIQRDEHGHRLAEALLCVLPAQAGHGLQVRLGRGRHHGHKVLHVAMLFRQGTAHVGIRLREDALRGLVPRDFL